MLLAIISWLVLALPYCAGGKLLKMIMHEEQHDDILQSYDLTEKFHVQLSDDLQVPPEPLASPALYRTKETIIMSKPTGEKYRCEIPQLLGENEDSKSDSSTQVKVETFLNKLNDLCFYKTEGWWTYEFCYKKHLRQFHQESDTVMMEFSLGHYDKKSDQKQVVESETNPSKSYYTQTYSDGTMCDLNRQFRQTQVRFLCNPQGTDHIIAIREPSTCQYEMSFGTPHICQHPAFAPREDPLLPIQCQLITDSATSTPQPPPSAAPAPTSSSTTSSPPSSQSKDEL
eukprot:TRINITY_DN7965_c0_g1::TRINITY_DN7965_c0_g1_i1::g.15549::m.15549 TRINITY_DN7965_c0_g1::TRINITY_DN7965_c0_g1_i1::g.15549  ORF type:complete len:298 (+),score=40.37,sp/Q67WM9/OS9_ORYSJ/33.49/1e-29,PRKCSH/PF07915.8/4.6e-17,PRKCSH/PF07915.8/5.7e+03,PRKCSH_1/PF13015.1/3.1e-06 TRINITY_DN7965_c0_g1_i1:40-894(+)